jgi:hypothetical protein
LGRGNISESLADLTGGVAETVNLKSVRALEVLSLLVQKYVLHWYKSTNTDT